MRGGVFNAADLVKCYAPPNLLSVMSGNRVMLRSGGPEMIVSRVDDEGRAVCQWQAGSTIKKASFELCLLTCYGAR